MLEIYIWQKRFFFDYKVSGFFGVVLGLRFGSCFWSDSGFVELGFATGSSRRGFIESVQVLRSRGSLVGLGGVGDVDYYIGAVEVFFCVLRSFSVSVFQFEERDGYQYLVLVFFESGSSFWQCGFFWGKVSVTEDTIVLRVLYFQQRGIYYRIY